MANKTKNKRSKGWKTTFILITSVTLIVASLIVVPTSIYVVRNNYSIARILPVSQRTKAKALWRSLDSDKLKKLEEEGKIHSFTLSDSNTVSTGANGCVFNFMFNKNSSPLLPIIEIRDSNGVVVIYSPFRTTFNDLEDNSGILSKSEVEELAKKGVELYNQFVDDYNNL